MSEALRPEDAPPSIYGPDGRPQFFADPAMDRFVPVVLNLASELWVQAETIANLRALLEEKGIATTEQIDAIAEASASDADREAALRAFIDRIFMPLREAPGVAA
ncbi:hypothetical protein [Rhizorhabdus sp. FW153]|uniref:hypothetical protein n=1 Tax=Rhizorhabdus sp. FW153 TaxID=3400216 RepID=UPI003CF97938